MSPQAKRFKLTADQIVSVAPGHGACIASDRIVVDGAPVGFMYRETADHSTDSGWRFFAGDESQEYADRAENFAIYDCNTIANYDRAVVPLLEQPVGSAFERVGGELRACEAPNLDEA